jgi:hypothetical protein
MGSLVRAQAGEQRPSHLFVDGLFCFCTAEEFFFTAEAQRKLPSFKAATVIILSHFLCASAVKVIKPQSRKEPQRIILLVFIGEAAAH